MVRALEFIEILRCALAIEGRRIGRSLRKGFSQNGSEAGGERLVKDVREIGLMPNADRDEADGPISVELSDPANQQSGFAPARRRRDQQIPSGRGVREPVVQERKLRLTTAERNRWSIVLPGWRSPEVIRQKPSDPCAEAIRCGLSAKLNDDVTAREIAAYADNRTGPGSCRRGQFPGSLPEVFCRR